jgi:hypothetical protein
LVPFPPFFFGMAAPLSSPASRSPSLPPLHHAQLTSK